MILCFALALFFGWSRAATQLDGQAYDWLFTVNRPDNWKPKAMLLAIDEGSLIEIGGARNLRKSLAEALDQVCAAKPLAIAVDLMLSTSEDPKLDAALATAFGKCPSVVLGADIVRDGSQWEEPAAAFRKSAASLGHLVIQVIVAAVTIWATIRKAMQRPEAVFKLPASGLPVAAGASSPAAAASPAEPTADVGKS